MNPNLRRSTALAIAVTAGSTIACSQAGLRKQYTEMRPNMMKGDWKTAVAQLDKSKDDVYGEKDRVMYWLNMGTLLHYAGDVKTSQQNFVNAEKTIQDLWTTSVTAEASKLLVNETVQSYAGEDFEKILIYMYTSLNHAQNNNLQDALVEARRADELLKKMEVHYAKEGNGGTVYTQDAFMLWLVGLYLEMEGMSSMNDAFLAYKASYMIYKKEYAGSFGASMPNFIAEDLVRTAKLIGFDDDAAKITEATGATGETVQKLGTMGEVIIVHGNGESPFKRELKFNGTMPDGYVTSVAVPQFVPIPPRIAYAQVAAGSMSAKTEVAEPVTKIVLKNFAHRLPAIKARAIARAIAKYAITKGAQAAGKAAGGGTVGALVGLAGNIAAVATEAADLRSWTTLPANIGVARLWLPPGDHAVSVTYHAATGAKIGRTDTFNVSLQAGQRKLISVRSLQ